MKVTVVTSDKGELVGTIQGEYVQTEVEGQTALAADDESGSVIQAGILLAPGQQTQEIDVSEDVARMEATDFLEQVKTLIE
jgi:hypothetical protein